MTGFEPPCFERVQKAETRTVIYIFLAQAVLFYQTVSVGYFKTFVTAILMPFCPNISYFYLCTKIVYSNRVVSTLSLWWIDYSNDSFLAIWRGTEEVESMLTSLFIILIRDESLLLMLFLFAKMLLQQSRQRSRKWKTDVLICKICERCI